MTRNPASRRPSGRGAAQRNRLAYSAFDDDSPSPAELDLYGRRGAALLAGLGLHRGAKVAILADRPADRRVAEGAVAAAGAVPIPLAKGLGPGGLRGELEDSGARVALISESLRGSAPRLPGIALLSIDELTAPLVDRDLERAAADF